MVLLVIYKLISSVVPPAGESHLGLYFLFLLYALKRWRLRARAASRRSVYILTDPAEEYMLHIISCTQGKIALYGMVFGVRVAPQDGEVTFLLL